MMASTGGFSPAEVSALQERALARWRSASAAATGTTVADPGKVTAQLREHDGSACVAVVAPDGEVLSLHRLGRRAGAAHLLGSMLPAPPSPPVPWLRLRTLRARASSAVASSRTARNQPAGLAARSLSAHARSLAQVRRAQELCGNSAAGVARLQGSRSDASALRAQSGLLRSRSFALIQERQDRQARRGDIPALPHQDMATTRSDQEPARPHLQVRWEGGDAVAVAHGELDLASAPQFAALLLEVAAMRPRRLVVDLAEVTFMDCSGVAPIVRARRMLPARCPVIVRSPSHQARRLLQLTGLDRAYVLQEA